MRVCTAFAMSLLVSTATYAAIIPGLWATGVDASGTVLPAGLSDPHWTVLETGNPAVVTGQLNPSWLGPNTTSNWIWQRQNGSPTNVNRTFRLQFSLDGLDPTSARISGRWSSDNSTIAILINGVNSGVPQNGPSAFSFYRPFTITSGFVPGLNTLDFVVNDFGQIAGLRVDQISGAANVPTPASALMLPIGALWACRRRRCA